MAYYKFAGDKNNIRVSEAIGLAQGDDQFDFTLDNIKPSDSMLRFVQDNSSAYFLVCPYGKFPNLEASLITASNHSCQSPTSVQPQLVSYIDFTSQSVIVNSRIDFTRQPVTAYNLTYRLKDVLPYDRNIYNSR